MADAIIKTWRDRSGLIAYVFLVVTVAFSFYLIQKNYQDDADRNQQQVDRVCESSARNYQGLIDFTNTLSQDQTYPPEAGEDARKVIDQANERRAVLREVTAKFFAPEACDDGVLPTPRTVPIPPGL